MRDTEFSMSKDRSRSSRSAGARVVSTLLLFCAANGTARSQDTAPLIHAIQTHVPEIMKQEHVPGLSLALVRDNRIAWTAAFGVRVAGRPEKVDDETIFEAASMSKPLFCYAVLKLVEEGKFDLDRPLDAYLAEPYLSDQSMANRITGRMVMLHRTGLPNWRKGGWRSGSALRVEHAPGSRFTYSGEGFLYLQTVVERITEQPLGPWIEARLLEPLNMSRSSYQWEQRFAANHAGGHDKNGKAKKNRRFYKRANAAYSLYTTPTDYARFLIEIMKRDRSAGHSLQGATIEEMTTLQVEPEGDEPRTRRSLGWIVDARRDGGWVRHTGTNGAGFHCVSRFHIGRRAGCVIMTNNVGARRACERILEVIDEASRETTAAPASPSDEQGPTVSQRKPGESSEHRTLRAGWQRETNVPLGSPKSSGLVS